MNNLYEHSKKFNWIFLHVWKGQGACHQGEEGTENVGENKLQAKTSVFAHTLAVYNKTSSTYMRVRAFLFMVVEIEF